MANPRIAPVEPSQATGKAKELLDASTKKIGRTLNLLATMAREPAVLDGYLKLSGALAGGSLPAKTREQIAIAVAAANGCEYCLAAHTALGKGAGVSEQDLGDAQSGDVSDPKVSAILTLARAIVENAGQISDAEVADARRAGLSDSEIVEVTANVAINVYTNYINNVARTAVDFPAVENRLHAGV